MSDHPFRTPPPNQPTRRRHWSRTVVVIVSLIPLTCLAGIGWRAGVYFYWRQVAQNRVNAEIKRLRTANEPLTADELHAVHRVPAGTRDLTIEWLAVLADLYAARPEIKDPQLQELPLIGPRNLEELEPTANNPCFSATEDFLSRIELPAQSLLKLSSKPGEVRFPVKFEDHLAAHLDHAQHVRYAAKVLEVRAKVCIIHREVDKLDQTLSAMVALVHTLDESRTIIEHLIRCAVTRRCCVSILEASNRGILTRELRHKFANALEGIDFKHAAWYAYTGERVMGWAAMDDNASLVADDPGGLTTLIKSAGPVDRAFLLDGFARAVESSRQNYTPASLEFGAIDRDIQSLESLHPWERMHYFYSVMIVPVPCSAFVAFFHQDAHCRLTQAALLAQEHRDQVGQWPSSVLEIAGDNDSPMRFTDPFSGFDLRIRDDGPNLVIYSVGANQYDDGGYEENDRWKPDIVVFAQSQPSSSSTEPMPAVRE